MSIASVRATIKTSLASLAANTYDHVPEAPILPAVMILPADPYIEKLSVNRNVFKLNIELTFAVNTYDNATGLNALEELIMAALPLLPIGAEWSNISAPAPVNLGQLEVLAAKITVAIPITNQE